jgi:hypothetical protein
LAAYLTWMAAVDWVRMPLRPVLARAPRPLVGWTRGLMHLEELFVLSWSFLFVACCVHYFLGRKPWAVFGAWAAMLLVCLNYPVISGDALGWVYRLASVTCLIASWGCIGWGMLRIRDLQPGLAHLVLMMFAGVDVALNLVPYAEGFATRWPLVRFANAFLLSTCILAHVWRLTRWRAARAS